MKNQQIAAMTTQQGQFFGASQLRMLRFPQMFEQQGKKETPLLKGGLVCGSKRMFLKCLQVLKRPQTPPWMVNVGFGKGVKSAPDVVAVVSSEGVVK